jgi:hypothetical protein
VPPSTPQASQPSPIVPNSMSMSMSVCPADRIASHLNKIQGSRGLSGEPISKSMRRVACLLSELRPRATARSTDWRATKVYDLQVVRFCTARRDKTKKSRSAESLCTLAEKTHGIRSSAS